VEHGYKLISRAFIKDSPRMVLEVIGEIQNES
jgi:hypothetical protein